MLTSPNLTLTLQRVPVATAGAAGGAVQAAQRIGSAIGSAMLVGIFYSQLSRDDYAYQPAISSTLLYAAGFMLLALSLSVTDLIRQPRRSRRAAGLTATTTVNRGSEQTVAAGQLPAEGDTPIADGGRNAGLYGLLPTRFGAGGKESPGFQANARRTAGKSSGTESTIEMRHGRP
jgi:hypothetical protein